MGSRYRLTTSWAILSATVGIPNGRVSVLLSPFGISTLRTGGGKWAPRSQSVPELVEVVRKSSLKVRNRLPIYSSRPLVGLHFLESLPDFPLRDVERLCLVHRAPPVTSWL